jgi:hypothetical protein
MDDRHGLSRFDALAEQRHDLVAVLVARPRVGPIDQRRHLGGEMCGRLEHDLPVEDLGAAHEVFGTQLEILSEP